MPRPGRGPAGADGAVTVASYVNNLHPREHPALYAAIAGAFEKCVPLLEDALTAAPFKSRRRARRPREPFAPPAANPAAEFFGKAGAASDDDDERHWRGAA